MSLAVAHLLAPVMEHRLETAYEVFGSVCVAVPTAVLFGINPVAAGIVSVITILVDKVARPQFDKLEIALNTVKRQLRLTVSESLFTAKTYDIMRDLFLVFAGAVTAAKIAGYAISFPQAFFICFLARNGAVLAQIIPK